MTSTVYYNGSVFTARTEQAAPTVEAFAVRDGRFLAVGTHDEVRRAVQEHVGESGATREIDLRGRFVAPGIIDSHTHLTGFGESLTKVQLRDCASLTEIQERLVAARRADPTAARVLGIGWLFDAVGDTLPTAAMLDEVLPDVPVYLDANDLHSVWVNTAALAEMGIDERTPDPIGGEIARDESGRATGMLYETACTQYGWGFLQAAATDADRVRFLDQAFRAYVEVGVTSVTEMSLNEAEVTAILAIVRRDGRLPFPVTAHWLLEPSGDSAADVAAIHRIVALRDEIASGDVAEWFRVAGVKFIMDGVIDACTATMRSPYANGSNAEPIWTLDRILPVADAADAAGLQIAMHAIGDRTSDIALDAIEHCIRNRPTQVRRHRIEHLESVADDTIARMADLGVTASMQPVHCDPAVLDNWKAVLGDERQETGFPWHKFRDAGVPLTLGTDAPTAPHQPLPNLYIALTGGSVLDPERESYHPERVFTPVQALTALTAGAALAGEMEEVCGEIREGLQANFIVLDVDPLTEDPRALLSAGVRATYVLGEPVHGADLSDAL